MGRKAARLAAKPHVVGSIALDQRLRAQEPGGGGIEVPEGAFDARNPSGLPVGPAWLQMTHYFFGVMPGWGDDPRFFMIFNITEDLNALRFVAPAVSVGTTMSGAPGEASLSVGVDPAPGTEFLVTATRMDTEEDAIFVIRRQAGMAPGTSIPPGWTPMALSFPWDTMTTHAQIDAWADANGVARGADWAQMTLASKRAWLVAYYDGDRPWETAS